MQIFSSKHKDNVFYQVYLTNEEFDKQEVQKKITEIKNSNGKVAIFVAGNNNYKKIIEKIICLEVEKVNVVW